MTNLDTYKSLTIRHAILNGVQQWCHDVPVAQEREAMRVADGMYHVGRALGLSHAELNRVERDAVSESGIIYAPDPRECEDMMGHARSSGDTVAFSTYFANLHPAIREQYIEVSVI